MKPRKTLYVVCQRTPHEEDVDLRDALDALPPHQRAVVTHAIDGRTLKESADLLGVALNTVWHWRHRACMRLSKILALESVS